MKPPERTLSRRAWLAGCVVGLSGCTGGESPGSGDRPGGGTVTSDPDETLRAQAADTATALLLLYSATTAAHPSTRQRLGSLAAAHRAHLEALARPPAPSPTVTSPVSAAASPGVPGTVPAAVSRLAAAERSGYQSGLALCEAAADGALARLLASIAASRAGHAQVLAADG